jgi:sugar phosphate isomerase/epimerase
MATWRQRKNLANQGHNAMIVFNVGIDFTRQGGFTRLDQLEAELAYYRELGFRLLEINPSPFNLLVNGELRRPQLANFLAVLGNFDFRYSVHAPDRLNLAYDPREDLCRRMMLSLFEICQALGASRLVLHSGLNALDDVYFGLRRTLLTDEALAAGALREVNLLKEVAPQAAAAGVIIGVENCPPHQRELDILARFDLANSDLAIHHARLRIPPIVRQLEAIDHPNVALTLDMAHLFLAANLLEFDFLGAVRTAVPWVKHLHANDNFGHLDRGYETLTERLPFGEGDLHLPPGWGSIPYREALTLLPNYEGDLILEIKPLYRDFFGEARQNMQDILGTLETSAT